MVTPTRPWPWEDRSTVGRALKLYRDNEIEADPESEIIATMGVNRD